MKYRYSKSKEQKVTGNRREKCLEDSTESKSRSKRDCNIIGNQQWKEYFEKVYREEEGRIHNSE